MPDKPRDRVVRIACTDAQWKAIRKLAVDREQDIRDVITAALESSPVTKKVFTS